MITFFFPKKLFIVVYYKKNNLWGGWDNLGYHSYKDKGNNNSITLLKKILKNPGVIKVIILYKQRKLKGWDIALKICYL